MTRPRHADPLAVYPAFAAGTDGVVVAAPAKLNLFLEIIRKRIGACLIKLVSTGVAEAVDTDSLYRGYSLVDR